MNDTVLVEALLFHATFVDTNIEGFDFTEANGTNSKTDVDTRCYLGHK